ncbi:YybS family protein [Desulfotomaculum sp. 1211_IL3151]|uniref:YybS family protein n=1 Tax=Desulfotomaculum sp. 1211_IL3151 TaxID=3084055 RepID=UPI002FDB9251
MASPKDTRALVDGALMAGMTAMLGLLGMFIPPFFLVIGILMPLPLAVLVVRRDLKIAVLSLVVTGLLMMMLYPDPLQVLVMFIQFGPLGLVLGFLYKNYVSPGHALITATLVSVIASILVISLSVLVTGLNLEFIQAAINESLNKIFTMYQEAGYPVPTEQQEFMRTSLKTSILLLPAAYLIFAVFSTALTYIVGAKVLKRLNYRVNKLPPFSQWRLPWYAIWGVILGLIFLLAGDNFNLPAVKIIGQNLLTIFGFAFFIIGVSVVAFYFKKLTFSKPFKTILLVLLILYISIMYMAIILLGLFDTILNLRRPMFKKNTE